VLFTLFIALTFMLYALGWLGTGYLIVIAAADAVLAFLIIGLLRSTTKNQGRKIIRWMYLTATVMVLAFVIARLIVN
jgi:heme O synthase-like polyprenyltransferase